MADKGQPTNADLLREFKRMSDTMGIMDSRISSLEKWKIAYDAAKEAVAEYKAQENSEGRGKPTNSINKELVKSLLIALGIISTLVAGWVAAQ